MRKLHFNFCKLIVIVFFTLYPDNILLSQNNLYDGDFLGNLGSWAYGISSAMASSHKLLIVGNGRMLQHLSKQDYHVIDEILLEEPARKIYIVEDPFSSYSTDAFFVANGRGGFKIYSARNGKINEVGRFVDNANIFNFAVNLEDNLVYLIDLDFGLRIIDISNPENIIEVSSFKPYIHNSYYTYDIQYLDGFLYYYHMSNLVKIDVRDPHNPSTGFIKSSLDLRNFIVQDTLIYVLRPYSITLYDTSFVYIEPYISLPSELSGCHDMYIEDYNQIKAIGINGVVFIDSQPAIDTFFVFDTQYGNLFREEMGSNGKFIINSYTKGLTRIQYWPGIQQPILEDIYNVGGFLVDSFVEGPFMYALFENLGLRILNIANPENIIEVGNLITYRPHISFSKKNEYIYTVDGNNGLSIIDASMPNAPRLVSTKNTGGKGTSSLIIGNYLYVLETYPSYGIRIFEIQESQGLNEIHFFSNQSKITFFEKFDHSLIFIDGSNSDRINVLDLYSANNPYVISSYQATSRVDRLIIEDDRAILNNGEIIDLSDKYYIKSLGNYNQSSELIQINGNKIHTVSSTDGYSIIDITNMASPEIVYSAELDYSGGLEDFVVNGNKAYITNHDHGVNVYDLGTHHLKLSYYQNQAFENFISIYVTNEPAYDSVWLKIKSPMNIITEISFEKINMNTLTGAYQLEAQGDYNFQLSGLWNSELNEINREVTFSKYNSGADKNILIDDLDIQICFDENFLSKDSWINFEILEFFREKDEEFITLSIGPDIAGHGSYKIKSLKENDFIKLFWIELSDTITELYPNKGDHSFTLNHLGKYRIERSYKADSELKNINFQLAQNYPNPFNPYSFIEYSIPTESHVTMIVYDIIGREVSKLVNDFKNPGHYRVKFDASYLSSGVYFYRLTSGSSSETRKMILIK